jgi:hypothetical protein
MITIRLPALHADNALGFLAAVGTLRLIAEDLGDREARLGWPDGPYEGAALDSRFSTVEELVVAIDSIVSAMNDAGQLLPGVTGFPPRGESSGSDPTSRFSIADGRGMAASALSNPGLATWCQAVVGLVPPIDRKTSEVGSLERNRFLRAGPGTVWVPRTLASVLSLTNPRTLVEAFNGWQRHQGFIGAYLDHRADVDKAIGQAKKPPAKRGVPGATFLALMSLPLFPVRSSGPFLAETVGWSSTRVAKKGFLWPVWEAMLDIASVTALVDHPEVSRTVLNPRQDMSRLRALGLTAVFRSLRIAAGNNDAALSPAMALWESHR